MIKKFKSNKLARKIFLVLYEQFYKNAILDKNIILYYTLYESDILVTKNYDIYLAGFGYLNLNIFDEDEKFYEKTCFENYLKIFSGLLNTFYFPNQYESGFFYKSEVDKYFGDIYNSVKIEEEKNNEIQKHHNLN